MCRRVAVSTDERAFYTTIFPMCGSIGQFAALLQYTYRTVGA